MKQRSSLAVAVSLTLFAAGSSIATGAHEVAVKKQRIAIEGTFSSAGGAFKLIPLTPGPLKKDSGRFTTTFTGAPSNPPPPIVRNGQTVYQGGSATDQMTGKHGTLRVSAAHIEGVSAGGAYAIYTGTSTFGRGTGVYAGLGGGGTFVAVILPGQDRFRYEGWVRAG